MAKLFQALRIEVNHEMDALKEMLKSATEILNLVEDFPSSLTTPWKTESSRTS